MDRACSQSKNLGLLGINSQAPNDTISGSLTTSLQPPNTSDFSESVFPHNAILPYEELTLPLDSMLPLAGDTFYPERNDTEPGELSQAYDVPSQNLQSGPTNDESSIPHEISGNDWSNGDSTTLGTMHLQDDIRLPGSFDWVERGMHPAGWNDAYDVPCQNLSRNFRSIIEESALQLHTNNSRSEWSDTGGTSLGTTHPHLNPSPFVDHNMQFEQPPIVTAPQRNPPSHRRLSHNMMSQAALSAPASEKNQNILTFEPEVVPIMGIHPMESQGYDTIYPQRKAQEEKTGGRAASKRQWIEVPKSLKESERGADETGDSVRLPTAGSGWRTVAF
uniref:Uncharacterized protein n=1 Tax=Psilocybe cubensis TaxID=181762 RepID=A0A8H8CKV8_PSICU